MLEVGRDGRHRLAPRPPGPLPAPAGRGPHRLRGHPAQPWPPATAAARTCTPSARPTTPSSTTSSGSTSPTSPPTTGFNASAPSFRTYPTMRPVLAGFEAIDEGRQVLDDRRPWPRTNGAATDLIWIGNVQLLEHEQRALVQPCFDHLSCAFARLISLGAASSFEVRGVRKELAYFTSFYLSSLTRGLPAAHVRARGRGSPGTTTVGAGSPRAWCLSSAGSTRTCTWSTPACSASSRTPADTRRHPARYPPRRHTTPDTTPTDGSREAFE